MTPREPLPNVEDWAARLDLRNRSGEYVGPCPACGGTDRFHVGRGRGGAAMVGCRGCIDGQPADVRRKAFGQVLREAFPERFDGAGGYRVDSELAGRDVPSKRRNRADSALAPAPSSKPRDTTAAAHQVWRATRPLAGTIAETYLCHVRGVRHVCGAPALRFHPALSHPSAHGRFPCLVAGVQDVHGGFLGVQRIYLDREGAPRKADVKPVRASLGSLAGGAVRLAEPEPGRPLLVGEGIESTAAAMDLLDLPAGAMDLLDLPAGWAALGTSGLRSIQLPPHVIDVVIAADRDANGAGQLAAADLAERLESEGRRVEIRAPCTGDFADWL